MSKEYFYPIERGRSTSPKKTEAQVDFPSVFVNGIPKVVLCSWNGMNAWLVEVTTTYFKWNNDSPSVDVTIDWIAVG